jgi:L-asparagine transporter-like permease
MRPKPVRALSVRSLVLIGIGGIIGAGFFLGCGLPIKSAGPGVLLAFLLGGVITAQVTGALTSIAVSHPVAGAYQVFPQMYVGRFAGYMQGWTYYLTSILTISSEAVAMAVFIKLWTPHTPTILLAGLFAAVIIIINAFGVKSFERVESIMSVLKIGALVGFIVYAVILIVAYLSHGTLSTGSWGSVMRHPAAYHSWLPNGWSGLGQSMLVVIFAYAGIGVFASAASDIKDRKGIDRAAVWTVILLTVMYILSIALVLWFVSWQKVSTSQSPFVYALIASGAGQFGTILNGVILVAAFSVMSGALFSANQILISLGDQGEAPSKVSHETRHGTPVVALIVSAVGIAAALTIAVVLPANVYSFLVSASSYFTFFNWFMLLWAFLNWRRKTTEDEKFTSRLTFGQPVSTVITMVLLVGLGGYALLQHDQRMGFYAALSIVLVLAIVYFIGMRHRHSS